MTEEQVKKLWEWYGFKAIKHKDCYAPQTEHGKTHPNEVCHIEHYEEGVRHCNHYYPPIDLKSLYKYPVPKLQDMGHLVELLAVEHKGFRATIYEECFSQRGSDGCDPYLRPVAQQDDDDPAQALLGAILKFIEEEK